MTRPTGLTADAGWEAGARRTVPLDPAAAWALLRDPGGPTPWLGALAGLPPDAAFAHDDGSTGTVRAVSSAHVRARWTPPGEAERTVQVRVREAATGTTVSFHEEGLADEAARERSLTRWREALDALELSARGR